MTSRIFGVVGIGRPFSQSHRSRSRSADVKTSSILDTGCTTYVLLGVRLTRSARTSNFGALKSRAPPIGELTRFGLTSEGEDNVGATEPKKGAPTFTASPWSLFANELLVWCPSCAPK